MGNQEAMAHVQNPRAVGGGSILRIMKQSASPSLSFKFSDRLKTIRWEVTDEET